MSALNAIGRKADLGQAYYWFQLYRIASRFGLPPSMLSYVEMSLCHPLRVRLSMRVASISK